MSSTLSVIEPPPASTTVFVVRHAHVHNPKNILYGRLPRFRLSEEGRRQADAVARFLSGRHLSAIYTSPLLRARQTAGAISTYHPAAPVRTTRHLLESRTGYEGQPTSILKEGFSFYEPKLDPSDESMEDIWDRMLVAVRRAVRRHAGGSVALVSHADPITILRVGLEARPMTVESLHRVTYPDRASVTEVVVPAHGELRITYFNVGESRDRSPTATFSQSESA